jgi:hypothetical protein
MGANPGVGQSTQGVLGFLRGYQGGIESPGTKMVAEDLEFGVVWEYDGTDISLTVIDGGYDGVDNSGATAVGRRFIHKRPTGEYNTCDLNDYFFIRIIRAQNNMPNSNNFCFQLFRSTTSSWDDGGDDEPGLIYNSEHSINTPLDLVPVFMANRSGVEIHGLSMVPLTDDSRLMLDPNFEDNDLFHANPYGANTMSMKLNDFDNDDVDETVINFWGNLGFYFSSARDNAAFQNDAERQTVQAIARYTYNYDIPRQPADVAYSFGDNSWDAIYFDNTIWGGGKNTIGYRNLSASLPRMLEVRINDLNVVTSSGSFVGTNIYDDNVVNRIVGTIPVPAEYLDKTGAFNMDISYEPYNLIYRSLRNVNDIMVNQLNIKISAKNFETNTEDDIKNINGTLKLEFHIKKI